MYHLTYAGLWIGNRPVFHTVSVEILVRVILYIKRLSGAIGIENPEKEHAGGGKTRSRKRPSGDREEILRGIVLDNDGATGARGLSTLAPWSMAVYKASIKK